jgi:hypothetical protein
VLCQRSADEHAGIGPNGSINLAQPLEIWGAPPEIWGWATDRPSRLMTPTREGIALEHQERPGPPRRPEPSRAPRITAKPALALQDVRRFGEATDTDCRQAKRRSVRPRTHSMTGRASPRSSSRVGHSGSPGHSSRMPSRSQAARPAGGGIWPSRARHRSKARASPGMPRPAAGSAARGSLPADTAATISAGLHDRSSAPSTRSPGSARKLSATLASVGEPG